MARILVIGPGAIGGALASWLAQDSRHELTLAVRTSFERLTLQTPDGGVIEARPRVLTNPADVSTLGTVDWALVTTKAYDVEGAVKWLKPLLDGSTRVAVIQNGVEHVERFSAHVAVERIVPVMIDLPVERTEPGKIRQRGAGRMVVPRSESASLFADLFVSSPLSVTLSDDFKTQVWQKLCLNSAGAVGAVLAKPSVISRHDGVANIMRAIVRECVAVGRAESAQLDDSIVESVINNTRNAPPDSMNSLVADRVAGRPMETDARNGVIVRLGKKHGIATPINEMMVAMLEASRM